MFIQQINLRQNDKKKKWVTQFWLTAVSLILITLLSSCTSPPAPEQTVVDQPPENVTDADIEVDPDTKRLVGEQDDQRFWVGDSISGRNICLISTVGLDSINQRIVTTCTSSQIFATHGMTASVKDGNRVTGVYLPDGYTANLAETFPSAYVNGNLVVIDHPDDFDFEENGSRRVEVASDDDPNKTIELYFP